MNYGLIKAWGLLTGLALSHGWRHFVRRRGWLDRNRVFPFVGIFFGLVLLSVAQTAAGLLAYATFRSASLAKDSANLPVIVLSWFFIFLIWTLVYAVVLSRRRAVQFELEKLQLEVSVKDAELRTLQAQVNPHFFFNSLNSIRALIYQDVDAAAQAVGKLAGMMRYSLQAGQSDTVRLADEIEAVQAYLTMEKIRFEERLQVTLAIDAGLEETAIPPMALQTLVENAVKHGVELSMGACAIRISAQHTGDVVTLRVANQGVLGPASNSTQMGLSNTARRLGLLFGALASCDLVERDGWVIASLILPRAQP